MKLFLALCCVAAVAQAYDVDWSTVSTPEVFPEDLLTQIVESGFSPSDVAEDNVARITNGEVANLGQFPYQVAVLSKIGDASGFCGGSILNNEWILTAAHCVDVAESADVVFAAQNIRDSAEDGQYTVKASTIIVHENWDDTLIKNDIALLKLDSPITYSARVQPSRLPSRSQVGTSFDGFTGTVSGWGRDSDSATTVSSVLRFTSNPILRNARCNVYYFGAIDSNQVCLAGTGGRSSCNGDSGGPLVVTDTDGQVTQIGVVSFGILLGCSVGWPGVYLRTSEYLDWIETNTNGGWTARA